MFLDTFIKPKKSFIDIGVLLVLALLALIAVYPIVPIDWFNSHEGLAPIKRVFALAYEVRHGDFYPRWLSLANSGHGIPFFNYYSPSFYLLAGYLYALGIPLLLAVKAIIYVAFLVGSVGMYFWSRKYNSQAAALSAAMIYMYLPYHFVDLYVRGDMAEFLALAILPYLFLGIDLMFTESVWAGYLIATLSSASIVITHNLTALMITPFAAIYLTVMLFTYKPSLKKILFICASFLLGALISGFYWLPVLMELDYIRPISKIMATGYYFYGNHFVYPLQWFDTSWGFAGSWAGPNDGMSFQIGIVPLIMLLLGTVSVFRAPNKAKIFFITCLYLGVVGLLFTSFMSQALYQLVAPLKMVQFPWRFLGPATLFIVGSSSLLGYASKHKLYQFSIVAFTFAAVLVASHTQRTVKEPLSINVKKLEADAVDKRLITHLAVLDEYLPKWSHGQVLSSLNPIAQLPSVHISKSYIEGSSMRFTVEVPPSVTKSLIVVPWHYFPGWRATVDGHQTAVSPGPGGFIVFSVPGGTHQIALYFGTTSARIAGWAITLLGLLFLVKMIRYSYRNTGSNSYA